MWREATRLSAWRQASTVSWPYRRRPELPRGLWNERDAPPVSLAPGGGRTGFDIILLLVPVFRISGRVVDERGEPAAGATVEAGMKERKATTREDGTFELERVRSGEGALRANWQRGNMDLLGCVLRTNGILSGQCPPGRLLRIRPPRQLQLRRDAESHVRAALSRRRENRAVGARRHGGNHPNVCEGGSPSLDSCPLWTI
ncbi:MAG: carboxypeptidase regulatory-like domain-containing protein, partial [Acidimicrobiia bacterium]|nr:carboxypeptidase regulatory-like domain-containing protein [Acidimicrobiia bacterium]